MCRHHISDRILNLLPSSIIICHCESSDNGGRVAPTVSVSHPRGDRRGTSFKAQGKRAELRWQKPAGPKRATRATGQTGQTGQTGHRLLILPENIRTKLTYGGNCVIVQHYLPRYITLLHGGSCDHTLVNQSSYQTWS